MSKVTIPFGGIQETGQVSAATITTGWTAGQFFQDNAGGLVSLATAQHAAVYVVQDATTELSAPPTGSLVTLIHGTGTLYVDHSAEVAASSAVRAYESDVLTASVGAPLYCSANSKWTGTAYGSTGSVKGILKQIPSASNNYTIGIVLRM